MASGERLFRRRVAVAATGVLVTTAVSLFWMKAPDGEGVMGRPRVAPRLLVSGSGEQHLHRAEAELLDPSPLFFPTVWNYGQEPAGTGRRREPDEGFQDYLPRYRFSDQRLANYGREAMVAPERLADLLDQGVTATFTGFGEVRSEVEPLADRGGFIEVKSLGDGRLVLKSELRELTVPSGDYAPVEFLVTVGPAGLVGGPLVSLSSGSDAVDSQVRNYVLGNYRLGERLGPGKYVVTVGP